MLSRILTGLRASLTPVPTLAAHTLALLQLGVSAYATYWMWSLDWSVYEALAPHLYTPVGLAGLVSVPYPSLGILDLTRILATGGAIGLASRRLPPRWHLALGLVFAMSLFLLDLWHNGFGFVDEQIHLVWFAGLLSFAKLGGSTPIHLFSMMELIVCMVYLQSGFSKLWITGLDWALTGTTLQIAWIRQEQWLGAWLAESSSLAILFSCVALAFELSFVFYFVLGRWRFILLAASLGFHAGTWLTMGIGFVHLWVFAASVMIALAWNALTVRRKRFGSCSPVA